jgi:ABC-2 type transport system ATP-binding protein
MTTNGTAVLAADGLRMHYGATDVLHGVDFRVRRGEVLCLLGPNGAGKTTAVEILEGFRMRTAGRVEVLGTDPAHGDERWRARIGIVLQSWRDHGKWRVGELLAHLGSFYACYATELVARPWDADALMAAVGLAGLAQRQVRTLSGGQRRRLDLAVGLVGRPDLVFLDEPTAGLDPVARREFHDLARGLRARGETTIVLTTHDLAEAEALADRILVLDRGRIVADGTPAELARQIAGRDEVRWTRAGRNYRESTAESTAFAFRLFREHGEVVENLEIRRASLEDTYLALVRRAKSEHGSEVGDPAVAARNQTAHDETAEGETAQDEAAR